MPKKRIYFIGVLANTDSSVLKVNLDHCFKIETISDTKGRDIIAILEGLPSMQIGKKLFMEFPCLDPSERKLYLISNSFESNIEMDEKGVLTDISPEVSKFDHNLVYGYLHPAIRLIRLFKEGNICMPLTYYYFIDRMHRNQL